MRKPIVMSMGLALLAAGVALLQTRSTERPLATIMPSGALVYAEAKDLNQLLRQWDQSAVKRDWLASANFEVFANSNLYQKLSEVFVQYSAAAGFTADLASLIGMAGDRSAVALYELREVEFLAITRLGDQQLMRSRIWAARSKFEERRAGAHTFYLRRDPVSRRTVAFAFVEGYLFLATRDDLVARALDLLGKSSEPSIAADPWYRDPVSQRPMAGELRMVLNLESMVRSTYFRSYWIHRNVSAVARLRAGVADFERSAGQMVESRLFLRASPGQPETAAASRDALAQLAALMPNQSGLLRGWANPDPAELAALIETKLLAPKTERPRWERNAPYEAPMDGAAGGNDRDLETRIDEPALDAGAAGAVNTVALQRLLAGAKPEAVMHSQQSAHVPGALWIATPSLIVITAPAEWNANAVREAIGSSVDSYLTTARIGVRWVTKSLPRGGAIEQMDGLVKLNFAVRGRLLYLANDEALLANALASPSRPVFSSGPTYWAAFHHAAGRQPFVQLMTALDSVRENSPYGVAMFVPGGSGTPPFFSGNAASVSRILGFVESVEVQRTELADAATETITYRTR